MKKGFTLMEILAVLLVIAVILTLAVPVLRTVRLEVKNSQAKAATKKLAEAVRSYYNASRGSKITDTCFVPTTTAGKNLIRTATSSCNPVAATGIPATSQALTTINQLFACGYLSHKDFENLPYNFCTSKTAGSSQPCNKSACDIGTSANETVARVYAVTCGDGNNAGAKYKADKGCIFVDGRMKAMDTYE